MSVLRVLGLEEEELRRNQVGDFVCDLRAEKDDAVLEQPRVDVVGALAAAGLLDHNGDKAHGTSTALRILQGILAIFTHGSNARRTLARSDLRRAHQRIDGVRLQHAVAQLAPRVRSC